MIITTLIDNVVYGGGLTAEHGFSLYIENGNAKILFDTGQSDNFIKNANILGIDLSKTTHCILSHGHYDHTGGITGFIKINKLSNIYLKKEAFYKKYKMKNKYIGIPFNINIADNRFRFTKNVFEISKDIFVMTKIKIYNKNDTHFNKMFVKINKKFIPDQFIDEQFLVIKNNNSLIIISGCSHRGITNIVKTAVSYFKMPVELIMGGFHFKDESDETICRSLETLNKFKIKKIGISHCTGIDKFNLIKNKSDSNVFYNYTGNTFNI